MNPIEIIDVSAKNVACEGLGGALGHPRVFLEMGEKSAIDCPYCGRRFQLNANPPKGQKRA